MTRKTTKSISKKQVDKITKKIQADSELSVTLALFAGRIKGKEMEDVFIAFLAIYTLGYIKGSGYKVDKEFFEGTKMEMN